MYVCTPTSGTQNAPSGIKPPPLINKGGMYTSQSVQDVQGSVKYHIDVDYPSTTPRILDTMPVRYT